MGAEGEELEISIVRQELLTQLQHAETQTITYEQSSVVTQRYSYSAESLPTTEGSGAATCITFGSLMRATAAVGMDSGAVHVQKIGMDDATGMVRVRIDIEETSKSDEYEQHMPQINERTANLFDRICMANGAE